MAVTDVELGEQPAPLERVATPLLPIFASDLAPGAETRVPEHEWPANLFIFLARLTAWGLAIGSVACLVSGLSGAMPLLAGLGLAVALAIGSAVQLNLVKHVRGFTRWGWFGAMAELAIATLTKVGALATDPVGSSGVVPGIVVDVAWMRYFWNRRADFDVDLDF